MRWLVEAADTKTGQETAITVEALTEADAERLARYNGLLVARVRKAAATRLAPVVPYAKPAPVVPYAAPLDPAPAPELPQLARRARAARHVGAMLVLVGWVALVVAAAAFIDVAVRRGSGAWDDWRSWLGAAADVAWRPAAGGLAALAAGTALRLLAAMALALRAAARAPRVQRGADAAVSPEADRETPAAA